MSNLLERTKQHLATQRLLKRGERVVVAVSGGLDSMVLLHLLLALAPGFGWKLSVAHFNHRLRGRSSNADERLVRATTRRLKLPCAVASADVRRSAVEQGGSIEMTARRLRHEFLARCARKHGARVVALAHHADDQVELFFLRLLRGAGGDGLGGMKARNPSPVDPQLSLVRPLLDFSKAEIAAFAREADIRFREDASNASPEYERNWVRLKLLPLLRRRHPAVGRNILRLMRIVGAEAEFVTQAAAASLGRMRCELAGLPVAVQRRVVQLQLRSLGVAPDLQLVEELRTQPGRRVSVGRQVEVLCDAMGRVEQTRAVPVEFARGSRVIELPKNRLKPGPMVGKVRFGDVRFAWRILHRGKNFLPVRAAGREFFDADRVGARLGLRHWRAGDRFQPIGLPAPTKLQDWFTNRKIPAARRRNLILAETERGEVFWVEGERIGELCKVTPCTRRVLEWRWKRA